MCLFLVECINICIGFLNHMQILQSLAIPEIQFVGSSFLVIYIMNTLSISTSLDTLGLTIVSLSINLSIYGFSSSSECIISSGSFCLSYRLSLSLSNLILAFRNSNL